MVYQQNQGKSEEEIIGSLTETIKYQRKINQESGQPTFQNRNGIKK